MNYGYLPKFSGRAADGFRSLEPWLQEEVLDEVDRILASLPVPTVAQRLASQGEVIHDMAREGGGVEHVIFITTILDVIGRQLQITRVGRHARP